MRDLVELQSFLLAFDIRGGIHVEILGVWGDGSCELLLSVGDRLRSVLGVVIWTIVGLGVILGIRAGLDLGRLQFVLFLLQLEFLFIIDDEDLLSLLLLQ